MIEATTMEVIATLEHAATFEDDVLTTVTCATTPTSGARPRSRCDTEGSGSFRLPSGPLRERD
jgi:hypothetical protein